MNVANDIRFILIVEMCGELIEDKRDGYRVSIDDRLLCKIMEALSALSVLFLLYYAVHVYALSQNFMPTSEGV